MVDLTQDELTCLAIANEGECMLAIARWEQPIDHLVELGLMQRFDKFNNVITPKGREAIAKDIAQVDLAFATTAIDVHNAQTSYKNAMEFSAQQLANAARQKQLLTGQFPNKCAYDLAQEVLRRALEILG